jgi:hypothetical protein
LRLGLIALLFLLVPFSLRAEEPVRVLIIEGNPDAAGQKGDAFYVEAVFKAVKGYAPTVKELAELEKPDLKKYPAVFLLNLPRLSDKARANLEDHVKAGGGVAFFLGDKVVPAHYNRALYRKGEGLFPVALANQPTAAPEEKTKNKEKSNQVQAGRPAVYLRESQHPICADLSEARAFFTLLDVDRHYPLMRVKTGQAGRVQEVVALPNDADLEDFKPEAQKLNRAIPVSDDRYKDFRSGLEHHQWAVRRVLVFGKKACELGDALDAFLEERGDPKDSDRPDLSPFWKQPEVKELRQNVVALRDKSRYGDPLVIASTFGKGRVVVCLTSAGPAWNDWAGGPASLTFVILTANMAKHLAGADR